MFQLSYVFTINHHLRDFFSYKLVVLVFAFLNEQHRGPLPNSIVMPIVGLVSLILRQKALAW